MNTRFGHEDSTSRKLVRTTASASLLMLALGTAAAVNTQSAAQSVEQAQFGTYSLLYSFQCSPDGDYPYAGLVRDRSGNLYGTTFLGGQYGDGIVFKVTPNGTETVLHSFAGSPSDRSDPQFGSLTLDAAGNLYGTTPFGGEFGSGTVFKVTATGTESVLYNFCAQPGCADGSAPYGGMARDSAGNLYGTTANGGSTVLDGVVFKLTPRGTESVLHNFRIPNSQDGTTPSGNLIRDSSGNLCGTTANGGTGPAGTVFEVTASGTESVLHSFKGAFPMGADPPVGVSS